MTVKIKESDMYLPLKSFLENEGYEVYAEVPCCGRTADLIGVKNNLISVIETKLIMNLSLVEQVFSWRQKAHFVYAAVPMGKSISLFSRELLRNAGIGLLGLDLDISGEEIYCSRIVKYENAQFFRRIGIYHQNQWSAPLHWDQFIIPEHRQNISGVRHADIRISRYRLMMDHVQRFLKLNPEGLSIEDLADRIDMYYFNPRQGLYNALRRYEKDWCEFFRKPGERKTYVRIKKEGE